MKVLVHDYHHEFFYIKALPTDGNESVTLLLWIHQYNTEWIFITEKWYHNTWSKLCKNSDEYSFVKGIHLLVSMTHRRSYQIWIWIVIMWENFFYQFFHLKFVDRVKKKSSRFYCNSIMVFFSRKFRSTLSFLIKLIIVRCYLSGFNQNVTI